MTTYNFEIRETNGAGAAIGDPLFVFTGIQCANSALANGAAQDLANLLAGTTGVTYGLKGEAVAA